MNTQFHALRLNGRVTELVVQLSSSNHIDLNSVYIHSKNRVIIGEPKCGKVIHVQTVKSAFGKPGSVHVGMYDLSADRAIYREVIKL